MTTSRLLSLAALALTLPLAACGQAGSDSSASRSPSGPPVPTHPAATSYVSTVDNPFFPLPVGRTWTYVGRTEAGVEHNVVTVTARTRVVDGVVCVVVHDVVRDGGGRLVEDTDDWFAQDVDGNVWYFGEDTTELSGGSSSTAGSWEAGVDGARAGLVMPAHPAVGQAYRQEYLPGEAEDQASVLAVDARVTVPAGRFTDLVQTLDFTALEPDADEHKLYARGVGLVASRALDQLDTARLVSVTDD
ncbi:MAG: hypothetical protein U0R80_12380 [Nocardioidaceae bacterium]